MLVSWEAWRYQVETQDFIATLVQGPSLEHGALRRITVMNNGL